MKWDHHNPRGPRSCPSYAVSSRHYLVDPIRPTRGHIAFSPHGGLYAMPSLCGSAEATHEWFRAFAIHSVLAYRLLAPCTDLTGCPASGAFTSALPAR